MIKIVDRLNMVVSGKSDVVLIMFRRERLKLVDRLLLLLFVRFFFYLGLKVIRVLEIRELILE